MAVIMASIERRGMLVSKRTASVQIAGATCRLE
jgi:hypothetical protein